MTEMIELKLTATSVHARFPCTVCGGRTEKDAVLVEADYDGPHSGVRCCDLCLKAGDLDARLEEHAARLESQAAWTRSLIGRLKAPTHAEWQAYNERVDMARHASYCIGSSHGDADPRADLEYDAVMADDEVYAMWREQLKQEEYDHNRQLARIMHDRAGSADPVGLQVDWR